MVQLGTNVRFAIEKSRVQIPLSPSDNFGRNARVFLFPF